MGVAGHGSNEPIGSFSLVSCGTGGWILLLCEQRTKRGASPYWTTASFRKPVTGIADC